MTNAKKAIISVSLLVVATLFCVLSGCSVASADSGDDRFILYDGGRYNCNYIEDTETGVQYLVYELYGDPVMCPLFDSDGSVYARP